MAYVLTRTNSVVASVMTLDELREFVASRNEALDKPINYNCESDLVEFVLDLGYDVDTKDLSNY